MSVDDEAPTADRPVDEPPNRRTLPTRRSSKIYLGRRAADVSPYRLATKKFVATLVGVVSAIQLAGNASLVIIFVC